MDCMIDEVLLEIFLHLDGLDLVNASLVCKRWAEIISSSSYLIKNFNLIIDISMNGFKVQSVFPNGKYQNLTLTTANSFTIIPEDVKDFIKDRSEIHKNVTLSNFDRLQSIDTLSCLTNITKLTISNFQYKNVSNGFIDMLNLRHLKLENSILFQNVIGRQSIRTLKIFGASNDAERIPNHFASELNNLLQKCSNLKKLILSDLQISNPNFKSESFEFNLEALTVENFNLDEQNFNEFLLKQKESLKKLAISSLEPKIIVPKIIFQQLNLDELEIDVGLIPKVFNSSSSNATIKKLTIRQILRKPEPTPLELDHDPYPQNFFNANPIYAERQNNSNDALLHFQMIKKRQRLYNDQMERFERNSELERENPFVFARIGHRAQPEAQNYPLNLVETEEKNNAAQKIISACTAIKNFTMIDFTFDSLMEQLYWSQTNLKILKLQILPEIISPTVQFDNLEVIEIDQIKDTKSVEICKTLVNCSPSLQTLKINSFLSILFDSKFFISVINKAQNLREFHIGTTCKFTLEMINAVNVLKDCVHPLSVMSFEDCSFDDEEFSNNLMKTLKLNFYLSSTKNFSPMINQTQLGCMRKEIDEKNKRLKQQIEWSLIRQFEIERFNYLSK